MTYYKITINLNQLQLNFVVLKVALYQPDIAGNVGTIMRLSACLDLELNIIEPCGFPFTEDKIRRSAMDYFDHVKLKRYSSFEEFKNDNKNSRIILLSTKAPVNYTKFEFRESDILMVGRESAGVPEEIHNSVDARVIIPMKNNMRCLNVAISLSIVLGEAMRQCNLMN